MGCQGSKSVEKQKNCLTADLDAPHAYTVRAPAATLLTTGTENHAASKLAEKLDQYGHAAERNIDRFFSDVHTVRAPVAFADVHTVRVPVATLLTAGTSNHSASKLAKKPCGSDKGSNTVEGNVQVALTGSDAIERKIKVSFAGEELWEISDLAVYPRDTVWHLCRRAADLRDAAWATLLLSSEPLDETLLASSIPNGQILTVKLQNDWGWERPDRLSKTMREQILWSLDRHGVIGMLRERQEVGRLEEAFKQSNWEDFLGSCMFLRDFGITVLELEGKRYANFIFHWASAIGKGGERYGSIHAVDSIHAILCVIGTSYEVPLEEQQWVAVTGAAVCDQCWSPITRLRCKSLEQDDDKVCETCYRQRHVALAKAAFQNVIAKYGTCCAAI